MERNQLSCSTQFWRPICKAEKRRRDCLSCSSGYASKHFLLFQLTDSHLQQDEGNTNYSISIPRTAFDRRTNAELVARGLATLGIPASVNERNDVAVDKFKMSHTYPFWMIRACNDRSRGMITSQAQRTR